MASRTGTPVIVSLAPDGRPFRRLREISTRKDDPASFAEKLPQCLIADCPDLLPIREFLPSTTSVYSLAREVPVNLGDRGGLIDNLLVTNDGYLVIVEDKLFRNPEAIREVVTQTLQYGMAVSSMRVRELEASIRRGIAPALRPDEGIVDAVRRIAGVEDGGLSLADDFEEALERHLRRGEILLLVVTDGIRLGVERVIQWLESQASSAPFRFGLVELKFYSTGEERIVVPRTTMATREISRHVVVVDIQPRADVDVSTTVVDEARSVSGIRVESARQVKPALTPITREAYLSERPPATRDLSAKLIDELESRGLEMQNSPRSIRFGFTTGDGDFHSLIGLDWAGAWAAIPKRDRDLLSDEDVIAFKSGCNQFARFYKEESLEQADASGGVAAKFEQLATTAGGIADFLLMYRDKIVDAWERE